MPYSPGPVAVPLDIPEDALPLLHRPPPHLVPEAGPAPHPPAGEVTGGGGEHMAIGYVLELRKLQLFFSNLRV